MRCPDCSALMNRHAEKPVKGACPDESAAFNDVLGEVIAAIHCCPGCGKVEAELEARSR